MNTPISTKLAALAVALLVNGLMLDGVAYLFDGQLPHGVTAVASNGSIPAVSPSGAVV